MRIIWVQLASHSLQIVLLRAIGPITHKIMSMAQWREASAAAGFIEPQTWLATGNMIAQSRFSLPEAQAAQQVLLTRLGLPAMVVAVLRAPETLHGLVAADPFPDASRDRPSQMGIFFFAADAPDLGWVAAYDGPERLAVVDNHLVVDFCGPISGSPRLPGLIEKKSGAATARNWNTLRGLSERAAARLLKQS
ncbi:MAG: hypothetical protein ABS76_18420 [Pelagibacterium sp. SCN 64-44]|nr:MAG: hypothetical protein ABS76_18420 [Pelagibacterium sp. SCN 64-44]